MKQGTVQGKIRTSWRAADLLSEWVHPQAQWADLELDDLAVDHHNLAPGGLFLACVGTRRHGLDYAHQAIEQGARLIAFEPDSRWTRARAEAQGWPVPLVPIEQLGVQASHIAARFYDYPGEKMRLVGVTGTNGKTSVSHFLAQALEGSWACALTGTIGNGFLGNLQPATHTTPDAAETQKWLARLHQKGAKTVVMEASSHALAQHRLDSVPFHTAIFTNLSRDHLDYHPDMVAYAAAKKRLFSMQGLQLAVLNADDPTGADWARALAPKLPVVVCGRQAQRHDSGKTRFVHLQSCLPTACGMQLEIASSWGEMELHTPLLGAFNALNLSLVLAVLLAWGMEIHEAVDAVSRVRGVPGRMQSFRAAGHPWVVVDYAHTPDALENALSNLRMHTKGKLWCLFGCGGERDRGKRAQMGAIAERLADRVVVTDDNPRHESPHAIVDDILRGMERPACAHVVHDRRRAITEAIAWAEPDDVVLIAGKGHENYQQIGDLCLPFSDLDLVSSLLEGRA